MSNKLTVVDGKTVPRLELEQVHAQVIALPERNSRMLLAATLLVRAGVAIIPMEAIGYKFKSGNVANGKQAHHTHRDYNNAIVTEDTVMKHWSQGGKYEGCGIGIVTGPPKSANNCLSLYVIDIDVPKEGEDKVNGMDTIDSLESDLGPLPLDGPVMATPSGGRHLIFAWADGLTNSDSKIGPSVDSRGGSKDADGNWGRAGHITYDPDIGYKPVCSGYVRGLPTSWRMAFIAAVGRPTYSRGGTGRGQAQFEDMDIQSYVAGIGLIPKGQRNSAVRKVGLSVMSTTMGDFDAAIRAMQLAAEKCEGGMSPEELEQIVSGVDKSRVAKESRERGELKSKWQTTEKGKPRQNNEYNANIVINSEVFQAKWKIAFDEFYWQTTVDGKPLSDHLETEIRMWMTEKFRIDFAKSHVRDGLGRIAQCQKTHRFREWLEQLPKWDGVDRYSTLQGLLIETSADVPDFDQSLNAQVLLKTVMSAIARAYDPYEKVRHMTILIGPQDSGKSDFWKFLCPVLEGERAFTDSVTFKSLMKGADGQRDLCKQTAGCVFAEVAEMTGLTTSNSADAKHFLSGHMGKFVNKYEKYAMPEPIHAVLAGTGNQTDLFKDKTGLSRWHPISCTAKKINTKWLIDNLDQLWSQALSSHNSGVRHWFESTEPEYDQLQERAAQFHATWGETRQLVDAILDGDSAFDGWFVSEAIMSEVCFRLLESRAIEAMPKKAEQDIAIRKAGWVPTRDTSYHRLWKFKVTAADLEEFGDFNFGRPLVLGNNIAVEKGWVSPQAWRELRPLSDSDKARTFFRMMLSAPQGGQE